jgi:adenine phosphoribosyltransferase
MGDPELRFRIGLAPRALRQPAMDWPESGVPPAVSDQQPQTAPSIPVTNLKGLIRDIPDFPKPGILFKDITPLLANPAGLALSVEYMMQPFRSQRINAVIGAESRGFIFGTAVAQGLSCGFVPVRKPGKLPSATQAVEYELEYGTDRLEMHNDALKPGEPVLVVDDLLATGGTLAACCELVEKCGGKIVGVVVLIELSDLQGRNKLKDYPIYSVLKY